VIAARSGLDNIDTLLRSSDLKTVSKLLSKAPYSSLRDTLLALVQGPGIGPEGKKSIGTEKRYGLGADVLIMVGGLSGATEAGDASKAREFVTKAKNALDEIIAVCREAKL